LSLESDAEVLQRYQYQETSYIPKYNQCFDNVQVYRVALDQSFG